MVRGFSLVELVVCLAILAVLGTMAAPLLQVSAQRGKEAELKAALRQIRGALDRYKAAVDEGRIEKEAGSSGYPPDLAALTKGMDDKKTPETDPIYFLRRLPRDPLYPDTTVSAEDTWGLRSYASPPDAPASGDDVFDVYSMSQATGLNGIRYSEW